MSSRLLAPGDVIAAFFPEHHPRGHEQEGRRPAIVAGLPSILGPARFPLVVVVPLTTDRGQDWANLTPKLYPRFPKGTAGLSSGSIVLLDQIRALEASRVKAYLGTLKPKEFTIMKEALKKIFQL